MSQNHICSFCGKSRFEVKKLIAGPSAFICNECIELSNEVLTQEKKDNFLKENITIPSPKTIKAEFDKYIIGQDQAKKAVATVVSNHYKQLFFQGESQNDIGFGKSNVLMIGPTSSGKTLMIRILKQIMEGTVPIALADATTLTEAGYVGDDVESIVLRLLQEADFNVEKAQKGIIFIDEIDKIAAKKGPTSARDVSGEGVQQALLGLLQGKTATISPQGNKKGPGQETITIDTTNILFICAGAFSGLEKIIEQKNSSSGVGFHSPVKKTEKTKSYKKVESDDLVKFGMIPEILGRLPIITKLEPLTTDDLIKVLKEPKNAIIKQYKQIFKINGAELEFEDGAYKAITDKALKKDLGARGLRSIIEDMLQETMYELESNVPCKVTVTKESAEGTIPHKIEQTEKSENN